MPQDKDFKRIVRRRMASSGEAYTTARAALDPQSYDVAQWLDALGVPERAPAAYAALKALPEGQLRPAAVSGLERSSWRIRRSCCRLLDDLTLTSGSIVALQKRLQDEHPLVRRAALHTLTCKHCKPDGCTVDVQSFYERMAADSSRRVRSAVLNSLAWPYDKEPWAPDLARRFAEHDPSQPLRRQARAFLEQLETRRRSNELRLQLPGDLRAKTERHQGKWVAVAGGRIVGVDDPRAFRAARRTHGSVTLYWVAP